MSNLTEKVHYDQRSDQIKIDGPVNVPTREFMSHLRDEGLGREKVQQIWAAGDNNRTQGNPNQGGGQNTRSGG